MENIFFKVPDDERLFLFRPGTFWHPYGCLDVAEYPPDFVFSDDDFRATMGYGLDDKGLVNVKGKFVKPIRVEKNK